MPPRAHRPALTRTHSRSSSNGSSKMGLNLQITQKDPPPPRISDKAKKNAHLYHEPPARTTSPYPRTNSAHHLPTREQGPLRRPPASQALTSARTNGVKPKADFRISSPSEGDDDDEWVSSESGAATPSAGYDSEEGTATPVDPPKPPTVQADVVQKDGPPTPRAETPTLPRSDTARQVPLSPMKANFAQPVHAQQQQSKPQPTATERHDQRRPQVDVPSQSQQQQQPSPPVSKALSETHSPPRISSPDPPKRQSMTRPPSTHSVTSRSDAAPLRPHPLIRGHSYGHSGALPAKPATLAPLTVSSDAAQAQMSTVSSPSSLRADSPISIKTTSASPSTSPSSSQAHRQLRRTSTSSLRSMTSTAVPPSAVQAQLIKTHDRQRTMSAMSSTSSFAALSSLAMRSTPSPPRTPIHFTSHFPPAEQTSAVESVHPLLPPPYLSAHLTVLAYRNPIAESYDRVIRAKQRR
ncbi:predicted protein [Sparassis crispa]|uniref:Uncharacterized protein n=1 Tax=Sparassis crispa TaxID=139825 RepID=A0A401GGW1_9APHY|nr:predicted protein [Sparassis crispa]GBE81408.1 predicted protein [Sparassis crispa]